jgi:ParB/RepB/Spo0J family partition protein
MSDTEKPETVQGNIGMSPEDVSYIDPSELSAHPKNREIYGDTESSDDIDDNFVESVSENGVIEPLVATTDKQIISGHRRWIAAKTTDVETVPVRTCEFDDDLAEREALIEFNRQREKTSGQIVNEFEEMLEIEKKRGKEKMSKGSQNSENHDSWQRASEKTEVSRDTLSKGKRVKDKAKSDDEPDEVKEAAQDAWDGLQSGDESFNSAHEQVKQAEREVKEQREKEERETKRRESFESTNNVIQTFHGDFREVLKGYDGEIDHFFTDPPYDEDALELWDALGKVASEHLPDGGFLIAYSGKAHLPDVHDVLSNHLSYYWQGIVTHQGPGAKIFSRKLRTGYKPILIYQKGDLTAQEEFVSDVISGTGREKDDHEWQQAEGEAAELLERFTALNDTVCDPMCGSGTIGVACSRLRRRAVLIERDEDTLHTAREKVRNNE